LGYEQLTSQASRIVGILVDQHLVETVDAGVACELVVDETPFYAESGGQVGDRGEWLVKGEVVATVQGTYPAVPGLSVHRITTTAPLAAGMVLQGAVAEGLRSATMRNHTATHLLHAALRQVLGSHVKQAGSVVDGGRLRFDFAHYTAMDAEEVAQVEFLVNQEIMRNTAVSTSVMELDDALSTGAMALFGEKYGEKVRVVQVPGFSRELCGGTHVSRTGDIGLCKIVYEGSISAGVRRIEAITGNAAVERFQAATSSLHRVAQLVHANEPELVEQVEKLVAHQRTLEKELQQLKQQMAQAKAGQVEALAREVNGVKVLAARVDGLDRDQMRALADTLRNKWKSAVVVLGAADGDNVALISAVTKELTAKVHAGKLIGPVAAAVGGKGGGRPDLAEAGGKDASALDAALESVYAAVEGAL
jgi:alanyl-tRNA synthetase